MHNEPITTNREDFLHNPEVIAKLREILNELKQMNNIIKGETK